MKDYDFCLCTHWCISCHWLLHCMPHFKYHAIFLIKFHIKVMQKFFLFFVKKLLTKFLSHSIISNVSGTRQNTKEYARVAQLVEHDLAKVGAAGSSPVSRSHKTLYWWCVSNQKHKNMREWLSWWSTTLPRSGPRVRVPSRALFISPVNLLYVEFTGFFIIFFILIDCKYPYKVTLFKYKIPLNYIEITGRQILPASLIHF